jgi:transcriptional regulator with XRE-family HTH domain
VDNPQHEWVSLVTSRQGAWERAGTIGHVSAASSNRLGDFLRASRARLDPADAGLIGGSSRRVPGLRREEVAVLAGVSADYYARLEQGRERNPSAQVIDAIGRALCLSPDARGHAYRLAGLSPSLAANTSRDVVHPALLQLLDSFPSAAAYVLSPAFDVLATNSIAAALLSPDFPRHEPIPRSPTARIQCRCSTSGTWCTSRPVSAWRFTGSQKCPAAGRCLFPGRRRCRR